MSKRKIIFIGRTRRKFPEEIQLIEIKMNVYFLRILRVNNNASELWGGRLSTVQQKKNAYFCANEKGDSRHPRQLAGVRSRKSLFARVSEGTAQKEVERACLRSIEIKTGIKRGWGFRYSYFRFGERSMIFRFENHLFDKKAMILTAFRKWEKRKEERW